MKNTVICTLFENHYHYGVAALVNSLHKQGYRGTIYVGYRGGLPKWALQSTEIGGLKWIGARKLSISEEFQIIFLPLQTDYHLTNYKPDFMLDLWEGPAQDAEAMFYFDSDIVANSKWSSFDKWVDSGVALCEDVNSPVSENHPRRSAWRRYFGEKGITLNFKDSIYVNGGFIGLSKENNTFLELWKTLQEKMAPAIGGLNRSSLNGNTLPEEARDQFGPFPKTDQDALNATVEAWDGKISFVGKEGMGFKSGTSLMSHALDQPKPWQRNPLVRMLSGITPGNSDKDYWRDSSGPIYAHSKRLVRFRKASILIATAVGRFYRRSVS